MVPMSAFQEVLAQLRDLTDAHRILLEQHGALQRKLDERPAAQFAQGPLYMGEDEEDARFALEQGLIDQDQFEDVLRQANLLNTTVEIS